METTTEDSDGDFRPAYVTALKTWLTLASVVMFAIWIEAAASKTLTDYLALTVVVFVPGFLLTAAYVHVQPDRAPRAAFIGFVLLSLYFILAFVFALRVGPEAYSFLVFSNCVWSGLTHLYSSLFLSKSAHRLNIINAIVVTSLASACAAQLALEPATVQSSYGMQPYVYSVLVQWAYFLGARVIIQLYQKMRSYQRKANFLRQVVAEMVGHEVGTPLQGATNNIELLDMLIRRIGADQATSASVGKAHRALEQLRLSMEQIQRVLDNAAASTNGSGSTDGLPKPAEDRVNILAMMEQVIGDFGPRAASRGLKLSLDNGSLAPGDALTDRTRLTQIANNLLSNAIKYTDSGGVTLSVRSRRKRELEVSVADTGIGIPREAVDQIFEPYVRLPEAKRRGTEGSGLGLAVVKRELAVLGGRIEVTSVHGEGSTFTCVIPVELRNFCQTDPSRQELAILVVDDSDTILIAARDIFEGTAIACITAAGGVQALETLSKTPVDLVFLDMQMPDIDGFEVAKRLRSDQAFALNADVPIVGMSASGPHDARTQVPWFNWFLRKPFAFSEATVRQFVVLPGSSWDQLARASVSSSGHASS